MAFDRAAAKEAGYSNEEIEAFIAANPGVETKQDKDQRQATKLPSPEEVMGRTGSNPSQEVDRTNEGLATTAMAAGAGAAAVGVPVLAYKAGKAILSPAAQGVKQFAQQGLDVGRSAVNAMENRTAVDALREGRMQGGGAYGRTPVTSVAPTPTYNVPTSNAPQMRMPTPGTVSGPVVPEPSMASKVQAAAAQRISNLPAMGEMLGGAARMAGRALGPLSAVMQTTDTGPAVPSTGRMRGMEINPLTGRPWTPQQIAQYESNPQVFDAQMAQPQMRR
jgi:hypothetical protein